MSSGNPYDSVGMVAVGDHFVERGQLGRMIERRWRGPGTRPGNLSVLGLHRTGKTSLVQRAADRCQRTDLDTIFIDVATLTSGEELFRSIIQEALEKTKEISPDLDAIAGGGLKAEKWDGLRYAVTKFFEALRENGHHIMIVLDEFDRAADICRALAYFQLLRNLASEDNYSVGLITISRRRVDKIEINAAGRSILGGVLALTEEVGMFASAEADTMLGRALPLGIDLRPERERILDLTGFHPYLLELLCCSIVDHYKDTNEVDVESAYEEVAGTFTGHFDLLAEVIERDLGKGGLALLRDLAGGTITPKRTNMSSAASANSGWLTRLRHRPYYSPPRSPGTC